MAGLTFDSSGNLYGTATEGGLRGGCCGVAFELSPPTVATGAWTETVLHTFTGADGEQIATDLVFDGSGNIYGAAQGGDGNGKTCPGGCGTIFELSPPSGKPGPWTEKTLFRFNGMAPGGRPATVLYKNGLLYGVTFDGGMQGVAFVLSPSTKRYWTEVATPFTSGEGAEPEGLVVDPAVSGTSTFYGAAALTNPNSGFGTIFSWTP
jgi:hypothetical protein